MVVCLERGADLHYGPADATATHCLLLQVLAHPGSPRQRAVKQVCMCVSNTHTHTHPFNGPFPGLPGWAGTRKVKPIWILLKQETVSGSGISWAYASLHLAPDR